MRWQRLLLTLLALFFAVPVHGATITGPAFMVISSPGQPTLRVGQIGNNVVFKGEGGTTVTTDRAGKSITFSSPLAPAGRDGATWYSGSGEAATGLGKEGDFYFRTDTSSVYKKVSGLWGVSIANLKGPSGSNGAGVPPGGLPGQVLGKASTANNDTVWIDPPAGSGGSGGVAGVATVYGRSGAVWAQVGDYDTSQVPDTFNKRYVTDAQRTLLNGTSGVNTGNETTATIGNMVAGATAKAVPNDSDSFGLSDFSAANTLKKSTWANIKATLKSYFDTLYHGMTVTWDEITGKPTLGTASARDVGTAAGTVAAGNDSRFTDARTPTAHAATHAQGGSDPVTLSTAQVTGLDAALAGKQGALANAGTLAKVTEAAGLPLWNGSAWPGGGESGGDMFKAVYDPQGKNADAFARANHTGNMSADNVTDGTTNKAYTATEKTKLAAITGTNTGDETTASIKSKLGAATNGADGYLTAADHAAFAAKQNALVAGVDYMAPSSSISGNAGSATKLQTARSINGVPFDGTQPITIYDSTKVPTTTTVNGKYLSASIAIDKADVGLANVDNTADLAKPISTATQAALNAKISSDSPTITGTATFTGTVAATGITGPLTGNASTATKLQTARNINGVPFDGSANITVTDSTKEPAIPTGTTAQYIRGDKTLGTMPVAGTDYIGPTGSTSGNAGTATKLATPRAINGVPFDGSAPITVNAVDATARVAQTQTINGVAYGSGNITINAVDATPRVPQTTTVNGHALSGNVTVSATDVGLPNVDNTSDANKPVSTATQAALDLKAPKDNPIFTTGVTTPAIIPSSPDGTWRMNVRNTVPRTYTPQEGDMDTDANGKLWIYHNGAYEEKAPIATSSVFGISKPGNTLTITNGVLDVMLSSLGSSGLVTAGLSGDATIRKGFAYVTASSGKWTFANYSSGTTTLFSNYSGTVCAATSGGLNIKNPVTFANRTSSCAKVWAGTDATFRSIGDGKYWVTSNRNLTKQTGAASGTGGGGGGASWQYSTITDTNDVFDTTSAYYTASPVTIGASTTITGLAFKPAVVGAGGMTCKLALYDTATPSNLLANGTCSPVAGSWCSTPITYTGSASATYRVAISCNNGIGFYGVTGASTGIYAGGTYAAFPTATQSWDSIYFDKLISTAICTGGTCGGLR